MGDLFVASTQYDDIVGTVAFDGHEHPPLFELAAKSDMPTEGYWPVGFEFFRLDPDENGSLPFTLVAVKREEAGASIEDIIDYAKSADELRVYRFTGTLKPADFGGLFKRIDIKAMRRDLKEVNTVAYSPPEHDATD